MAAVKTVLRSSSVAGGHAIGLYFQLDDGSPSSLQIPFEQIPFLLRAIWAAAAVAETTRRQAAGEKMIALVAPFEMRSMRTGHSPEGTIVADFATAQGPVQIAMTADQARLTSERLTAELANVGKRQFPRPS